MVTFFRFSSKPACILACALALCVGCNDDDKKGGTSSKESLALTSFHPNYGKYQEKVILQGKGFGDPSQMRVYFLFSALFRDFSENRPYSCVRG